MLRLRSVVVSQLSEVFAHLSQSAAAKAATVIQRGWRARAGRREAGMEAAAYSSGGGGDGQLCNSRSPFTFVSCMCRRATVVAYSRGGGGGGGGGSGKSARRD